ncbi:MAG: hypothetical protein ABIE92_08495 [bacterium]
MKKTSLLLVIALLFAGCEEQSTDLGAGQDWAHIQGTVKYASNLAPAPDAFVRTITHIETALTDSTGQYDLAIALPKGEQETVELEIYKEGYYAYGLFTVIQAGETTNIPTVTLERYLDSTVTDTGYTGSGPGEQIVLISIEPDTIGVYGFSSNSTASIICEVWDASNRPVDSLHTAQILFEFLETPGGGAFLYPESDVTDHDGRVNTTFHAGTIAGQVIIKAQFGTTSSFTVLTEILIYETGPPYSIQFLEAEYDSVAVKGTGANESSTIHFVIKDATGSPITGSSPYGVDFEILGGPGGGEYLFPDTDTTDVLGQVHTTLNSGTISGAVQIKASLASDPDIVSTPIPITIHSGLPDLTHFGVYPRYINFPGYNFFGRTDSMIAMVGDVFANPVPMGTAVYYSSDAGIIQGSATTDSSGFASVLLFSGPPIPPASYPFGTISAQTVGEGGQILTATTEVLFSGITQIALLDTPYFEVNQFNSKTFNYRVMDQNGYPLAHDTKIEVSATAGGLLGDVNFTLPDTRDPVSWTNFSFVIYDDDTEETDPAVMAAITISVESSNGDASMIIEGTVD